MLSVPPPLERLRALEVEIIGDPQERRGLTTLDVERVCRPNTGSECPLESHVAYGLCHVPSLDLWKPEHGPVLSFDEALPGCHLVSSCSNIVDSDQFARMLRYNFERHFGTNRAPLGLHFNAEWIKKHKGFKRELIKFINEMLGRNDVYFVTMLQVRRG